MPGSLEISAATMTTGATIAIATIAPPNRSRAFVDGARPAMRNPSVRPAASVSSTITTSSTAKSSATRSRTASGTWLAVNAFFDSAQRSTGAAPAADTATTVMLRSLSGTIASHSSVPSAGREQRAARVRQEEGDQHEREQRVRERVDRRVAGAARAQPDRRGHRHRRGRAERVPVEQRLRQPRVEVVGADRRRPYARRERVEDDRRRPDEQSAQQDQPAVRQQPGDAERGREDGEVGERPVRLDPAVVGRDRPGDRQRRERGEQPEQRERHRARQPAGAAPHDRRGGDQRAADDERHLGAGRRPEHLAAASDEGDGGERGAETGASGERREARHGLPPADACGRRGSWPPR